MYTNQLGDKPISFEGTLSHHEWPDIPPDFTKYREGFPLARASVFTHDIEVYHLLDITLEEMQDFLKNILTS